MLPPVNLTGAGLYLARALTAIITENNSKKFLAAFFFRWLREWAGRLRLSVVKGRCKAHAVGKKYRAGRKKIVLAEVFPTALRDY